MLLITYSGGEIGRVYVNFDHCKESKRKGYFMTGIPLFDATGNLQAILQADSPVRLRIQQRVQPSKRTK